MYEFIITPRFYETDALGHISNTTLPAWFEAGRTEFLQKVFAEAFSSKMPLMVARYEVDMLRQVFYGAPVSLRSGVEHIGNSSIRLVQQAWQHDQLAAAARCVLVHFDMEAQRSTPVTPEMRQRLSQFLVADGAD